MIYNCLEGQTKKISHKLTKRKINKDQKSKKSELVELPLCQLLGKAIDLVVKSLTLAYH